MASLSGTEYFHDVVAVVARGEVRCSGVLVAPSVVLTAAHCLPAEHVVVATKVAASAAMIRVRHSIQSPDSDAALLVLDDEMDVEIRERRRQRDALAPVGSGRIVGFGSDDRFGRGGAGQKRYAEVTLDGWDCDGQRVRTVGCDPRTEMVLMGVGGRDTCVGDSGGPLFEETSRGLRLVGLTVRPTKTRKSTCGFGGVYLRLDRLDAWLGLQLTQIEKGNLP